MRALLEPHNLNIPLHLKHFTSTTMSTLSTPLKSGSKRSAPDAPDRSEKQPRTLISKGIFDNPTDIKEKLSVHVPEKNRDKSTKYSNFRVVGSGLKPYIALEGTVTYPPAVGPADLGNYAIKEGDAMMNLTIDGDSLKTVQALAEHLVGHVDSLPGDEVMGAVLRGGGANEVGLKYSQNQHKNVAFKDGRLVVTAEDRATRLKWDDASKILVVGAKVRATCRLSWVYHARGKPSSLNMQVAKIVVLAQGSGEEEVGFDDL